MQAWKITILLMVIGAVVGDIYEGWYEILDNVCTHYLLTALQNLRKQ